MTASLARQKQWLFEVAKEVSPHSIRSQLLKSISRERSLISRKTLYELYRHWRNKMDDPNLRKQILEATRDLWDRPETRPAVRETFTRFLRVGRLLWARRCMPPLPEKSDPETQDPAAAVPVCLLCCRFHRQNQPGVCGADDESGTGRSRGSSSDSPREFSFGATSSSKCPIISSFRRSGRACG